MASRNGSYTTSDLSRKSGDIIAEALRHPVTITERSKPRLVILNINDYERLTKGADARAIVSVDTMSDALFADMERAVEQYAEDDEVGR